MVNKKNIFFNGQKHLQTLNFCQIFVFIYFKCYALIQHPRFVEFGISVIQNFFPDSVFRNFEQGGISRHPRDKSTSLVPDR